MASKIIENFDRISRQLERAIERDDASEIQALDVALRSEFEALMEFQTDNSRHTHALITFLLERLKPIDLRSPLETRMCKKIIDLSSGS